MCVRQKCDLLFYLIFYAPDTLSYVIDFLRIVAFCLISRMDIRATANQQCKPAEASVNGKALKGHSFKTSVIRSLVECQVLCENELKCQSYNYFILSKICELNDRTKEARPYSFVPDENSVYMKSWPNRGMTINK